MGDEAESKKTKVVCFRLPLGYVERLERLASERGTKVGPMVAAMVMRRVDETDR